MQIHWFFAVGILTAACSTQTQPVATSAQSGASMAAAQAPAQQQAKHGPDVKGKVLETMDASNYTYVRIGASDGEKWAAIPQVALKVGDEITVTNAAPMYSFESKTLNRKFDLIYFGVLASADGSMPSGHPAMGGGAAKSGTSMERKAEIHSKVAAKAEDLSGVKIEKAAGPEGRTVAELFAQKEQLKDSKVVVRGKVVKFSPNIMGKNWVHLQDGTGAESDKTHDLTITTSDTVQVGDIATAKGVLRADKDFGAGYAYSVIIEEASVAKD